MELWIRSQSKLGLYKVDEVYIDKTAIGNNDNQHYILTNGVILGIYKSKERALEVLQEIHQRIIDLQSLSYFNINDIKRFPRNLDCVYEMPNE